MAAGTWLARAPVILFAALVFVLGLTRVVDTDTWTHLSFGRWIFDNAAIPANEPFITAGAPFPYNNWLFGFAYYLAFHVGGMAGVVLLKASILAATFGLLFWAASRPARNYLVPVVVLMAAIVLVRGRFVERPDTVMMLCLAFSIAALDAYVRRGSKLIYAQPLVHLIWANSHTSIALMAVPFGAFIAGGLVQALAARALGQRWGDRIAFAPAPTPAQIRVIALVGAASFLASLASPYFIGQYTHSVGALASDFWRQEILELQPPTWPENWPLFVFNAAVLASFLLNRRRISLIDLALVLPFLFLSHSAYRFVWFAAIGAVYLARNLSALVDDFPATARALTGRAGMAAAAAGVALTTLQLAGHERITPPNQVFGLASDLKYVPEGALRFMDRQGIGGLVFNTFQWGGYLTWRDFPSRKPFVDGRGFQDDKLIEAATLAETGASVLDELHRRFGFESVLVAPRLPPAGLREVADTDLALSNPAWALVYWDDDALLYLRREGPHREVIAQAEYRYLKPARGIETLRMGDPEYVQGMERELQRSLQASDASRAHLILGDLLLETGAYDEAIAAYARVRRGHVLDLRYNARIGSAKALLRLGRWAQAIEALRQALAMAEGATLYQMLGLAYASNGQPAEAIEAYTKAVELNPSLATAYRELAGLYQRTGRGGEVQALMQRMQNAQSVQQGEAHFKTATKAYLAKDLDTAIVEYRKSIEANPANPMPYSNLAYVHYDRGEIDKALDYHQRAIALDFDAANSHYGLALIFKAKGDAARARRHWKEYLRIEPSGHFARNAKAQLEALGD